MYLGIETDVFVSADIGILVTSTFANSVLTKDFDERYQVLTVDEFGEQIVSPWDTVARIQGLCDEPPPESSIDIIVGPGDIRF